VSLSPGRHCAGTWSVKPGWCRFKAGPDHVLALMPVAAVALLESAYPIGVTAALWRIRSCRHGCG
jgi:hypothetical protein